VTASRRRFLFFTHLPYSTAQLFFRHQSADSLKQAKNRLRKTILESDAPDKTLFLEMLEMKKGGRRTRTRGPIDKNCLSLHAK